MKYLLLIVFGIHIFNISYSQNRGLLAFRKLLVASSSTDTVAVNFYGVSSGQQVTTTNWNNVVSATNVSATNLVYLSNGSNSGIGISFTLGASSNWSDNGVTCSSPGNGFPQQAFRNSFYFAGAGANTTALSATISGLDNSKTYDIIVLGYRATATHFLEISVSGYTASTWEAGNNCNGYGIITGVSPSGGQIVVIGKY